MDTRIHPSSVFNYALIIGFTLLMGVGIVTLFAVLDFFSIENASLNTIAQFLKDNDGTFQLSLIALVVGYMLFAPVALLITRAAEGKTNTNGFISQISRGLVWASLALRPLWWVSLIVFVPLISSVGGLGSTAAPTEVTSVSTSFNMITGFLNAITEDIGVNILGGLWFVLVSVLMLRYRTYQSAFAWSGILIGLLYVLSSGELFGLNIFAGGNPIPTLVSIAGPLWLAIVGWQAVQLNRAES